MKAENTSLSGEFPRIMGIINVTPDSFSDGGMFNSSKAAIEHGLNLIRDGADILDIGGESTRPGSLPVDETEELKRILPVIEGLRKENRTIDISIDTTKYNVAKLAVDAGATMLNDVSALRNDFRIADIARINNMPLVLMHIQGIPRNMQLNPVYNDVVREVYDFLEERISFASSLGVSNIIADVGIGFGKTVEHNVELLSNLKRFKKLEVPIMLGLSRKSFIGKLLDIENPQERDIPTALFHAFLLESGVEIIRVHNVKLIKMLKDIHHTLKP